MTLEQMKQRLQISYPNSNPITEIEVFDLTGSANHWEVLVKSETFKGLSRIEQHQHVMNTFSAELKTGEVHALSIKTIIK